MLFRSERRLAALREPHVVRVERGIDAIAGQRHRLPLRRGVRLGDARRFENALHAHLMFKFAFAFVGRPGDGRRVRRKRAAGQWQMAFAREKARSRIEPDPSGAGQIDFAPRVQIGEIHCRPGRAIERFDVGGELNQIAGDETRGQTETAAKLNQEPAAIATRTGAEAQCFFRRLDPRLQSDQVFDGIGNFLIQRDEKIDRRQSRFWNRRQKLFEQRPLNRKSTRLNSSHVSESRMPSSA